MVETFRNQRLREVIDYLKSNKRVYNNNDMYAKIGKNKTQMSDTLRGRRNVNWELAELIANVFPEINPKYLMDMNVTDMVVDQHAPQINGNGNFQNNGHDQTVNTNADIAALLRIIEKQQEQIDALIKRLDK